MFSFNTDALMQLFFAALNFFQWLLTLSGVIIIIRGGLRAVWLYSMNCVFYARVCFDDQYDNIRKTLGLSIIIGLGFILAGDVISTVILPDYYNLGKLAILVIIRTVLTYFLDKELRQLRSVNVSNK